MRNRRQEILEEALNYLLDHGVADLSLRPLAAKAGTSARLLVYHFGSKEGLLTAVMDELRARIQSSFSTVAAPAVSRDSDPLSGFWKWASAPEHLRYLRLLYEVQVLALQRPDEFSQYLDRTSQSWLVLVESAIPAAKRNAALATLCVAVIDGLVLELLSTGDRRRTTRALQMFRVMIHSHNP